MIFLVGAGRDLPPDLISAFRATLEEIENSTLILHVVDCSDPIYREQMEVVEAILEKLQLEHIPRLVVFNKVDRLENPQALTGRPGAVAVSALKGEGLDALVKLIGARIGTESRAAEPQRAL